MEYPFFQRVPIVAALFILLTTLSACVVPSTQPPWVLAVAGDGPGDLERVALQDPKVQDLPKSRQGNPRQYEVFGRQYVVLDTAEGFTQRGLASWYGSKFHGRPTSSGEIYDMHRLTAAHKHLPLPTFVRVTRIDNGLSVIVKVNDRGPFVEQRIIDLSYAAAARLDMLEEGKVEVLVEALSRHEATPDTETRTEAPQTSAPLSTERESTAEQSLDAQAAVTGRDSDATTLDEQPVTDALFLQVGAYAQELNAQQMLSQLQAQIDVPARIQQPADSGLFLVQLGPLDDLEHLAYIKERLQVAGISSFRIRD